MSDSTFAVLFIAFLIFVVCAVADRIESEGLIACEIRTFATANDGEVAVRSICVDYKTGEIRVGKPLIQKASLIADLILPGGVENEPR